MADQVVFDSSGQVSTVITEKEKDPLMSNATVQNPVVVGQAEAMRDNVKEEQKQTDKFEEMVRNSQAPIYRLKSVFPFEFWPTEVNMDLNKVTIVYTSMWVNHHIHSVFIKDISDVFVETSLFFASLVIVDIGFIENEIRIKYLKKDEAMQARRIIQGLVVARKQDVDLTKLENVERLVEKLESLGQGFRNS